MSETSPSRASKLLKVLDLKQIEENLYQGQNETENGSRLFGGQVLAQASAAAYRTVDKVHLHSLHAYFLRPGRVDLPVLYEVERVRDGRSFTMRRVVAIQKGQAIFNMDASFQGDEIGLEHSAPMPNVPMPDELREDVEVARELGGPKADPRMSPMAKVDRPFHLRSVFELGSDAWGDDRFWNPTWIKFREAVSLPNAIDDPGEAAGRLLLNLLEGDGRLTVAGTQGAGEDQKGGDGVLKTHNLAFVRMPGAKRKKTIDCVAGAAPTAPGEAERQTLADHRCKRATESRSPERRRDARSGV